MCQLSSSAMEKNVTDPFYWGRGCKKDALKAFSIVSIKVSAQTATQHWNATIFFSNQRALMRARSKHSMACALCRECRRLSNNFAIEGKCQNWHHLTFFVRIECVCEKNEIASNVCKRHSGVSLCLQYFAENKSELIRWLLIGECTRWANCWTVDEHSRLKIIIARAPRTCTWNR